MSKFFQDHYAELVMDFGCIGEQSVDVKYDWHLGLASSDPNVPSEPEGPVIKDVTLWIDGNDASVFNWLSEKQLGLIADQIRERW